MTPEDLAKINTPGDPRLSPNGSAVLFDVSKPNLENDHYDLTIWAADEAGARALTGGPGDKSPRWSPDGKRIAFAHRSDDESKFQAAVMTLDDGDISVVSDFDDGIEAIEWSPDGSQLAVVAVTYTDEWAGLTDEERERKPRRMTSVPYRFDNKGWIHDRRRHIWLVDPDGSAEPRCLTPGDFDDELLAWSPHGKKIAFISDRDPGRGLVSGNDVCEVDVDTGDVTQVATRGYWTFVSYSPNGALHLLGNTNPVYPVDSFLYRREEDGSLTDLTGHLDRSSVSLAAGPARLCWDGDDAIIGWEDSGMFGVARVAPDGTVDHIVGGELVVTGFDAYNGRVVATAKTTTSPGELFSFDDTETQLTELNADATLFVAPEHFTVISDGHELDVWAFLPPGDDPVPLLLNIHGGPASQYGFGFFDEFQVYVGAGYGVIATNPRGSVGKGEEFTKAVVGEGWGKVDLDDIRAVVTASLERFPRLDEDRMGLMGGSYGGFLTGWVIGHEDRWKSAVVERALISWNSFAGTSDIGGVFPENYLEAPYPDGWDAWWQAGPLAIAHRVTTPTLILHAENDWRCPIEQGEQYFMALLRNGTPTEMIRFPEEGHEMSRSGKPLHRKERFDAILDWHGRYLMGD